MINSKHIIFYFLIITLLTNCACEIASISESNSPYETELTFLVVENFLVKDRGGPGTVYTAIGRETNLKFTINNNRTNINRLRVQFFSSTEDSSIATNHNALSSGSLVLSNVAAPSNVEYSTNINLNLTNGQYYLGACIFVDEESSCSNGVLTDVDHPGAYYPAQDFNTLTNAGNDNPTGIWSDGETMWVNDHSDRKIYAYNLETKERETSKDFTNLVAANNTPYGITSNGEIMYVADLRGNEVYAYAMASKMNISEEDFNLYSENDDVRGMWMGNNIMYVSDFSFTILFAYNLASTDDDKRIRSREFDLNQSGNNKAEGIWGNNNNLWVADDADNKIYAYNINTQRAVSSRDFNTLSEAGNKWPAGIWSDGSIMWVADNTEVKIYAYKLNF